LANDNVFSIAADKEGYVWFGTGGGGVSRFDSKRTKALHKLNENKQKFQNRQGKTETKPELSNAFETFTTEQGLANNNVYSIIVDKSGNLWFGTQGGGVSMFIQKCEMESSYRESNNFQNVNMPQEPLKSFVQSFISFTTAQGLANNNVWAITEDRSGNIWFGTQGGGVSRYDGNSFVSFTTEQGLANNNVYSIAEDKNRNYWFGTDGGGVSYYDGKSFTKFSTAQGLANNNVYCITEDNSDGYRKGNVWFGTQGGGVCRYDGKSFVSYTTEQGMANNSIRSITEDTNGNLCFGTYGGGLSFYDGNRVDAIEKGRQASKRDEHELKKINGKYVRTIINITKAQGLANNSVLCVTEDNSEGYGKGNLWIGTDGGGVSIFNRKSDNLCITNSCNHNFNLQQDIADHNKEISKSFLTLSTTQGLANNSVWCIRRDKSGNVWFGTAGGGISLLTKENEKRVIDKFAGDKNADTANKIHFINYTTSDGLPDNNVTQIVEGDNGKIYAGTKSGICELTGKGSLWKIEKVFNSASGYPVKDVNAGQNAMFKDSKGIIWISTGSDKTALIRFDSNAKQKSIASPKVILQKIRIDEASVCWYDLKSDFSDSITLAQQEILIAGKPLLLSERDSIRKKYKGLQFDNISVFYSLPENLVLPYRHNSISFDFVALETGVNFSMRYQYILEGYSKEWSPVTEKSSATFGNMYEGKYAFKVKARSPEGIWSQPLVYNFQVLPPWWRTWWAYGSYLLMFLWGLRIFSKIREWSLLEKQKVLEKTVEIRTAEVVAEKKKSDDLLLNILPEEVAEELKLKGSAAAKLFDQVTVMFTDFKGFTQISEKLSPAELVAEIDICFKAFDEIISRHNIEKIKTIGDSFMCAGGLPVINASNAIDVVKAAMEIQQFMQLHLKVRVKANLDPFEIRIGIHTGPVVAGIVGLRKFAYDIWGDTVNIASRMESSGEAGKINISGSTYEMVKDSFKCNYRGKIQAKNKGEIDMYFVESKL
jgi:class 3 adenylate cyclase/ligand-binding sensor domain-containing protein